MPYAHDAALTQISAKPTAAAQLICGLTSSSWSTSGRRSNSFKSLPSSSLMCEDRIWQGTQAQRGAEARGKEQQGAAGSITHKQQP